MRKDIILEIESLKRSFIRNFVNVRGETEDERFYIIDDLSLKLPKDKITALIGGNGAGKTTLFNIISGFMDIDDGDVLYENNGSILDLTKQTPDKITRAGIGRMFQDNHIFQTMSVLDNMLIADQDNFGETPFLTFLKPEKYRKTESKRINKVEEIFNNLFGDNNPFWEKRFQSAGSLSYGQRRLLGLARLLMGDYKLLLLDEPTSGVNPSITEKIKEIFDVCIGEKKMTIFLIEHNMDFVREVAEFYHKMSHGKIAKAGYTTDLEY